MIKLLSYTTISMLIYFKSIVQFDGENYKHISLPPPRLKASPSCAIDRIERSDWSCFVFPTTDGCWVTKAAVSTVCDSFRITRVICAKTLTPRNFSTKTVSFQMNLYLYAIPLRAAREKEPLQQQSIQSWTCIKPFWVFLFDSLEQMLEELGKHPIKSDVSL